MQLRPTHTMQGTHATQYKYVTTNMGALQYIYILSSMIQHSCMCHCTATFLPKQLYTCHSAVRCDMCTIVSVKMLLYSGTHFPWMCWANAIFNKNWVITEPNTTVTIFALYHNTWTQLSSPTKIKRLREDYTSCTPRELIRNYPVIILLDLVHDNRPRHLLGLVHDAVVHIVLSPHWCILLSIEDQYGQWTTMWTMDNVDNGQCGQ